MKHLLSSVLISFSIFPFPTALFAEPFPQTVTQLSPKPDQEPLIEIVSKMEQTWENHYRDHLDRDFSTTIVTPQKVEASLQQAKLATNSKAAFIWINAYPDYLRITISTENNTQLYDIEVTRKDVLKQVEQFVTALETPFLSPESEYLPPAQTLYGWIIEPILPVLERENIDTLIFCLGKGLRVLPFAALHNGENFLIEDYAVSRLPAFSLTNMEASSLQNSNVLAMGASEFQDLISLPSVPIELSAIAQDFWQGQSFLNQEFTLNNLTAQIAREPFSIVHLATHAKIESGKPRNSYIQLWNEQLNLDRIPSLAEKAGWSTIELLVLSACDTAVINEQTETIDEEVEMSFAGLALQAGVKSVIASSWDVSDQGTLGLMAQFYQELQTAPTKTIALQRAQLALLNQTVRMEGNTLSNLRGDTPLPEALVSNAQEDISDSYYWSTFTVIEDLC